jgi:hypothetical protein
VNDLSLAMDSSERKNMYFGDLKIVSLVFGKDTFEEIMKLYPAHKNLYGFTQTPILYQDHLFYIFDCSEILLKGKYTSGYRIITGLFTVVFSKTRFLYKQNLMYTPEEMLLLGNIGSQVISADSITFKCIIGEVNNYKFAQIRIGNVFGFDFKRVYNCSYIRTIDELHSSLDGEIDSDEYNYANEDDDEYHDEDDEYHDEDDEYYDEDEE